MRIPVAMLKLRLCAYFRRCLEMHSTLLQSRIHRALIYSLSCHDNDTAPSSLQGGVLRLVLHLRLALPPKLIKLDVLIAMSTSTALPIPAIEAVPVVAQKQRSRCSLRHDAEAFELRRNANARLRISQLAFRLCAR